MKYLLLNLILLAFGTQVLCIPAAAQEPAPPERFADIPKDSVGIFSLDFSKMRSSKDFELWPWEILDVAAKEQLGIDLSQVDAIDGMLLMPSPDPEFGMSIRMRSPLDISELPDQLLGPIASSPKDESLRIREVNQSPMLRVMQREATRVLLGTPGALRRMTSSRLQTGGEFIGLVRNSQATFKLALNLEPLRDLISAFALNQDNQIPAELVEDIEQIIDLTDNAMVELFPDQLSALAISLGTNGSDKAQMLDKSLLRIRKLLVGLFSDEMMQGMEFGDSVSEQMKQATRNYVSRMRKVIDSETFWEVQDDRLVMKVDKTIMSSYQVIGAMAGLLLPAVQSAREAARRVQATNNLKQIMLAMHNYHDAYTKFPAQALVDEDKNPVLSWRVAILPMLGEQQLYDQFHLDEPWDSDHNIKLLDRMPEFFRNQSNPPNPGITTYLTPWGEGVGLGPEGLKLARITDGTSNTLALVDVAPEFGVPWTKPDDFDINLLEESDWMRIEGSNAAFFDGSVRFLSPYTDIELLKALMTHSGGEVVPFMP